MPECFMGNFYQIFNVSAEATEKPLETGKYKNQCEGEKFPLKFQIM